MNVLVAIRRGGIQKQWLGLLLCGYTAIMLIGLQQYIKPFSSQFILGTVAVATSLRQRAANKQALRFGTAALAFALLYVVVPAKTMLFISLAMAVGCVLATFHYSTSVLSVFSMIMMSPIFDYAISVFSFPIKIYVTSIAAKAMRFIEPDMRAEGNFLISGNTEFSIDTACLGLHMLTVSMLAGLTVMAYFTKRQTNKTPVWGIAIGLLIVFLLNIVSNLIRIICLVFWKIAPDNYLHDVIGLVCFAVYVIAPMLYIIPRCMKFFERKVPATQASAPIPVLKVSIVMNTLLLLILSIAVLIGKDKSLNGELIPLKNVSVPGYTSMQLEHRVTKLYNENALVYIKPIAGFFSSDHQPMLCWSGSGYEFTKVHEKKINGITVYAATLEKGSERLYTVWWYDNGVSTTISQLEWRWNALRTQQHYSIVNVTAATPVMLEKETGKMLLLKTGKRE
jgi:exosortase N